MGSIYNTMDAAAIRNLIEVHKQRREEVSATIHALTYLLSLREAYEERNSRRKKPTKVKDPDPFYNGGHLNTCCAD
jgi:hypothetical protein